MVRVRAVVVERESKDEYFCARARDGLIKAMLSITVTLFKLHNFQRAKAGAISAPTSYVGRVSTPNAPTYEPSAVDSSRLRLARLGITQ